MTDVGIVMNAVQTGRQSVREPVFVICSGRSGSTLLRFLLDAHPELACPPETNMPGLCGQLATVWSLIEGAPLSPNRGDEPPKVPDAAIVGIRHTMDEMIGSYLDRRGKQRYCDKSLGTARFADLLLRVYPDAKLLCLYRHPMDVIASGLEACPWGLSGYGFDPFIAETPGNAVLALARFWTVNAAATLAVEERFPGSTLRVRYEDLVADPEHEAAQIFSFLGTSPAPGISATCFSGERERFGPGDYKIWRTSRITGDSVGRGWSVPAEMIHATVLAQVNELAENLGYLPVDDGWGTSEPPRDMRAQASAGDTAEDAHLGTTASREAGPVQVASEETVGQRLRSGLSKMLADPQQQSRWGQHSLESFVTVVLPPTQANGAEYWLVDLKAGEVRQVGREAQDDSDWDIVGSAEAWEKVLRRELNINVAIRRSQLRYCDEGGERWVALDTRISILSTLLGLPAW